MAKGSCCCSLCGVQLPPEANGCCLCVCDTICVEVRNAAVGGDCDCRRSFTLIEWNHDQCAYVGTVICGSLSIDVRFDIKKCSDGTCRLCLTSTCLGLTGQCGNAGCKEFSPGHNGDCGKYLKDCTQDGGWDETWNVDATGCLPPSSEISCPSISIHVRCYDRVNPAGSGTTRLCKDCDCVCECVNIAYEESVCAQSQTHTSCWSDSWSATLDPCLTGNQTITVELVRDPDTGCCNWKVTITKGVFAEGYPGVGTTEALIKTVCPDVDITLGVDLPGVDTGIITINCVDCTCVCGCPYLVNKWNNVDSLAVEFEFPAACGGNFTGSLLQGVGTPPLEFLECFHWGNSFSTVEFGDFDIVVWCDGDTVGMAVTRPSTGNCSFGTVSIVSASCSPFSTVGTSEVTSESGADPDPCPCTGGGVITITVT